MSEPRKPRVNSAGERELEKAAEHFEQFDQHVKEITQDHLNAAPRQETEPQVKMSTREMQSVKEHYLKPKHVISCRDKFNENFREQYNFMKTYVPFIAEHKEESNIIEIWTRPFPGMPAEEWVVPTNRPVWGPRYLAEQIRRKFYHRLKMDQTTGQSNLVDGGGVGQVWGGITVDTTVQRLDARPVSQKRSVFMGADGA